jgi:hypothetical protein
MLGEADASGKRLNQRAAGYPAALELTEQIDEEFFVFHGFPRKIDCG